MHAVNNAIVAGKVRNIYRQHGFQRSWANPGENMLRAIESYAQDEHFKAMTGAYLPSDTESPEGWTYSRARWVAEHHEWIKPKVEETLQNIQ